MSDFDDWKMAMAKLGIDIKYDIYQVPAVSSTGKITPIPPHTEQQNIATAYEIIDRVTISRKGKHMSQQYATVLTNSETSSILSYEIRKPFTIFGLKK